MVCAREDCKLEYVKKTHNQKYCSSECCRIETNRRIMQKYYANRDRQQGIIRYCSECQSTKLSRYNDSNICSSCRAKVIEDSRKSILNMVMALSA